MIIDLSSNNHPNGAPVDFAAAKEAGVEGVIVKATEGQGYVNPFFQQDVKGARSVGLPVRAYHYADFTDPVAEAEHFLSVAGILATWLDSETNTDYGWMVQFLNALNRPVGLSGIYGGYWSLPQGVPYPLWIPAYGNDPNRQGEVMWQYTGSGTCPGVPDVVDLSVWKSSSAMFNILFGVPTPSPPPPSPPQKEGSADMSLSRVVEFFGTENLLQVDHGGPDDNGVPTGWVYLKRMLNDGTEQTINLTEVVFGPGHEQLYAASQPQITIPTTGPFKGQLVMYVELPHSAGGHVRRFSQAVGQPFGAHDLA